MREGQEQYDFEERVARFQKLLQTSREFGDLKKHAAVMLNAEELLEACQYTLTLLGGLSSEDFIEGATDRHERYWSTPYRTQKRFLILASVWKNARTTSGKPLSSTGHQSPKTSNAESAPG